MGPESSIESDIARAGSGDLEAFGKVVDRFEKPIRGFIAMLGVPSDAVEDLAQETFLVAYRDLDRYDGEKPFGPWLRGIARNLVRRHWTQVSDSVRLKQVLLGALLARDGDVEPVAPLVDRIRIDHLMECLKGLSESASAMVHKKYSEGMKSTLIAKELGQSPEAVRMALGRARIKLRDCVSRRLAVEHP